MYNYITDIDSPNYWERRNYVEYITIHHWGGDNTTWNGTITTLCNPQTQVSAHCVLEAGRVAQLVDYTHSAWCEGSEYENLRAIGIECNPRCSAEDIETCIELIVEIFKLYGRTMVVRGHKDIYNTACPGRWYQHISHIYNEACNRYNNTGNVPTPPSEDSTAYVVKDGDTLWSIANNFGTTVDNLVSLNNLSDGGNLIYPGQTLTINGSSQNYHIVEPGDTMSGIADYYGKDLNYLINLNNLDNGGNLIYPGQRINLG